MLIMKVKIDKRLDIGSPFRRSPLSNKITCTVDPFFHNARLLAWGKESKGAGLNSTVSAPVAQEAIVKEASSSAVPAQVAAQAPSTAPQVHQVSKAAQNLLRMQKGPWQQR
jgi:hypothetical protein